MCETEGKASQFSSNFVLTYAESAKARRFKNPLLSPIATPVQVQRMGSFVQRWQRSRSFSTAPHPPSSSLPSEVKQKNSVQIKQKLQDAARLIQAQSLRLDQALARLRERDSAIFDRIVAALQNNENARAKMLANEVSEVRKMVAVVLQAKLALEQLLLRLSTIQELGDVAATLAPAVEVIRSIRPGLEGLVPEAENEIGSVSALLSEILIDVTGQTGGDPSVLDPSNGEDVDKVIAEAELVAERRLGSLFPEVSAETLVDEDNSMAVEEVEEEEEEMT
ncbi:MAG TPA: hypothetical protein VFF30_05435 [Nitrososphaerales archaeon]|nr:hypothetical protein [Nitrososphaerales archaeon]